MTSSCEIAFLSIAMWKYKIFRALSEDSLRGVRVHAHGINY
jgi:hypothetical protein